MDQQQLHKLFYSEEMKEIRSKYYHEAYQQGRFDEYAESTYGTYSGEQGSVKPIRPTVIKFETEEEYDDFIKYTTSTERDNSEGMERMRELMRNHVRSKKRE